MNDTQSLDQLIGNNSLSGSGAANSSFDTELAWIFWVGLISTVILTVMFIVYLIAKIRAQSAILRMDKNLQLLVDNTLDVQKKTKPQANEDIDDTDVV